MAASRTDAGRSSLPARTHVSSGTYRCISCGHVIELPSAGQLPTCPRDDGHHAFKAWHLQSRSNQSAPHDQRTSPKPR